LILTHTHAACGVFAKETRSATNRVEIRTIDSLVVHIATAYHKSLGLPPDPSVWAREAGNEGFQQLGESVARFLAQNPMVSMALAERYPLVIADEHQDARGEQHDIIMGLHRAGSRVRVFADPMQRIYVRTKRAIAADQSRWEALKSEGVFAELEYPHRWTSGSMELGSWVLAARQILKERGQIDLFGKMPKGLSVLFADNVAPTHTSFRLSDSDRKPVDAVIRSAARMLVLSGQNESVRALRAFWNRQFPIWEGHTREPLGILVLALASNSGDAPAIAEAVIVFLEAVSVRFTRSSHGNRFATEISEGCAKQTTGKPAYIQELARYIRNDPTHFGAAKCLKRLVELVENKIAGFDDIVFDLRNELRDALRLEDFTHPEEGFSEINRKRTFARPTPPAKAISTIHKAKGLECDHSMIIPCDAHHFSNTTYARCKLYVALSRAKQSMTLVLSKSKPSPLFKL